MTRPTKNEYYLGIAAAVAKRSTCIRRQYGVVIVKNDRIISTGYNGACHGEQNCIDFGECYRDAHNISHGERYELCKAVHAEQNAILSANRAEMIGATLYLAGFENGQQIKAEPCLMCSRMIKNARIEKVVGTEKRSPQEIYDSIKQMWEQALKDKAKNQTTVSEFTKERLDSLFEANGTQQPTTIFVSPERLRDLSEHGECNVPLGSANSPIPAVKHPSPLAKKILRGERITPED